MRKRLGFGEGLVKRGRCRAGEGALPSGSVGGARSLAVDFVWASKWTWGGLAFRQGRQVPCLGGAALGIMVVHFVAFG